MFFIPTVSNLAINSLIQLYNLTHKPMIYLGYMRVNTYREVKHFTNNL